MKILFQILIGIITSVTIFLILGFSFNEDLGPFFSLSVVIGIILGMQIIIYNKVNNSKKNC